VAVHPCLLHLKVPLLIVIAERSQFLLILRLTLKFTSTQSDDFVLEKKTLYKTIHTGALPKDTRLSVLQGSLRDKHQRFAPYQSSETLNVSFTTRAIYRF
jgi:hypothetical protein